MGSPVMGLNVSISCWLIGLEGDRHDLERLGQLFDGTSISIIEEGGRFFLKADSFIQFNNTQVAEVLTHGRKLLGALLGFYKAKTGSFGLIKTTGEVTGVDVNGERHSVVLNFGSATIVLEDMVSGTAPKRIDLLADLIQGDPMVATAFRYHSYPAPRWVNLYKVLDTIQTDVARRVGIPRKDAIITQGWATKEELRIFKGTANNELALEDEARHGKMPHKPMKDVMSLGEAELLLRRILDRWIEWRK